MLGIQGDVEYYSNYSQIRKALQIQATVILASNKEIKQKKGNVTGRFLHSHMLGLMARLTDVINDSMSINPTVQEQRRCIRALEEMIKICKDYARIARPQVRNGQQFAMLHSDIYYRFPLLFYLHYLRTCCGSQACLAGLLC